MYLLLHEAFQKYEKNQNALKESNNHQKSIFKTILKKCSIKNNLVNLFTQQKLDCIFVSSKSITYEKISLYFNAWGDSNFLQL